MPKFCGKCGSQIDEATGKCPKCDSNIEKKAIDNNTNSDFNRTKKRSLSENDKKDIDNKIKQRANTEGSPKKSKSKVKSFFIKLISLLLVLSILAGSITCFLAYFDVIDVPVVSNVMESIKNTKQEDGGHSVLDGSFTDRKVVDEESAILVAKEAVKQLHLGNAADMLTLDSENEVDNTKYFRLQQNYKDIPVYGKSFVVITDKNGKVLGFTGNGANVELENLTPTVTTSIVNNSLSKYYQETDKEYIEDIKTYDNDLFVFIDDNDSLLAYRFWVTANCELYEVVIDANDGSVLQSTAVNRYANDVKDDNINVKIFNSNGEALQRIAKVQRQKDLKVFYFKIDEYGKLIYFDENKKEIDCFFNGQDEFSFLEWEFSTGENKKGVTVAKDNDNQAKDLLKYAQKTYEFYSLVGRKGYDNNNGYIPVIYNTTLYHIDDNGTISDDSSNAYSFTFDSGTMLVFGKDDQLDCDLFAHEYTHSVERMISNMTYSKESGAIMEAYSDLFGELVEDYSNDDALDNDCNWTNPYRNLKKPLKTNNPKKYNGSNWGNINDQFDNGYVHNNSTVISYAAYLMSNGVNGKYESFDNNTLARLWYKTLYALPSDCDFYSLREYLLLNANTMGISEGKIECLEASFNKVNIVGLDKEVTYCANPELIVYDNDGEEYDRYTVRINGKKNGFLWFNEEYNDEITVNSFEKQELNLPEGKYTITVYDDRNKGHSFSKKVKIKDNGKNKTIAFATDFIISNKDDENYNINPTPSITASSERDVVLVLDTSGSMGGEPLEQTKRAAEKFVDTVLAESANVSIVNYDDSANMASSFTNNATGLKQIINELYDSGGTNIEAGLRMAEQMLTQSNAEKKIIVLMSDGEPNAGLVGEELISYSNALKENGTYIYTLGFFESMGAEKSDAQLLMEGIASEGCHYEVSDAESLVFFFGDIADQINGQKYIYVRIACPVDVSVEYNGETLDSSELNLNTRTDFGTLTFEDSNEETIDNSGYDYSYDSNYDTQDDRVKILRLKEGEDYNIKIVGTGRGRMDYSIGFMDENGEYSDFRKFKNVSITRKTEIDTVATVSEKTVLNVDEDGDGRYDITYEAGENENGQIVDYSYIIYILVGLVGLLILLILILVISQKIKKNKQRKIYR